jgi:hypothetical protein
MPGLRPVSAISAHRRLSHYERTGDPVGYVATFPDVRVSVVKLVAMAKEVAAKDAIEKVIRQLETFADAWSPASDD